MTTPNPTQSLARLHFSGTPNDGSNVVQFDWLAGMFFRAAPEVMPSRAHETRDAHADSQNIYARQRRALDREGNARRKRSRRQRRRIDWRTFGSAPRLAPWRDTPKRVSKNSTARSSARQPEGPQAQYQDVEPSAPTIRVPLPGVHGEGDAGGDEDHGSLNGMDAGLDLAQRAEVQRHVCGGR